MLIYILLFIPMTFAQLISMEPIFDEVAYAITAQQCEQATVNPAMLAVMPSPSLEILPESPQSNFIMYPFDELPLKKERKHPKATTIYEFPLGGQTYGMHFWVSQKKRKKNPDLTDWFNNALDLISGPTQSKSRLARIISFSLKTGKLNKKIYKPKLANIAAIQPATRISKRLLAMRNDGAALNKQPKKGKRKSFL